MRGPCIGGSAHCLPSRVLHRSHALAGAAPHSRALGNKGLPEGRAALRARLSASTIHRVQQLRGARLARRVDIVAHRRAPRLHGKAQQVPQVRREGMERAGSQTRATCLRTHPSSKQRLVGIDVAHARNHALVEQRSFDAPGAALHALGKRIPRNSEGVGPECVRQPGLHRSRVRHERERTKAAWIAKTKLARG